MVSRSTPMASSWVACRRSMPFTWEEARETHAVVETSLTCRSQQMDLRALWSALLDFALYGLILPKWTIIPYMKTMLY